MRSDCSQCNGTGWQLRAVSGGPARAYVERCGCVLDSSSRQRLLQARLPRKFIAATFQSFEVDGTGSRDAFDACRRLVDGYPARKRGLLLMGSCGVGKTHLAVATLKGLLQKGADGLFYDFRDLLDELRGSYDPGGASESAIMHRVFTVEVLVLDELGSEKMTDWVREIVHRVVIRRYNDERLTICTTNYLDRSLYSKEKDADPLETLEGRIGDRLRSRLYEMCDTVSLGGRDFRRQEEAARTQARTVVEAYRAQPVAEAGKHTLEVAAEALRKMAGPEREGWFRKARAAFDSPMQPHAEVERKAVELYRAYLDGEDED